MTRAKTACVIIVAWALVLTMSSFSATVYLAGRDADGQPMAAGSGHGLGTYFRPMVSDDATVAFLAPMPEYGNSDSLFRASYLSRPMSGNLSTAVILPGRDAFAYSYGKEWPLTHWALAAGATMETFFALRYDTTSDAVGSTAAYLRWTGDAANAGLQLAQLLPSASSSLLCSADGSTILLYERGGSMARRFSATANGVTALPDLLLPAGRDGQPAYDGRQLGVNRNGTMLYFAGTGRGDGLSLFSLRLADRLIAEVARGICPVDVDAELAVSPVDGIVAFCSTVSTLTPDSSTGQGTRVILAVPEDDGAYAYELCSKDLHHANSPAISQDGRFVVFRASVGTSAVQQVWRYDRLTREQRAVSTTNAGFANQDCFVPALSANGRYVAFVSQASNLGVPSLSHPQVWLADLGPTLIAAPLTVTGRQDLPLTVTGATADASLTLSLMPGSPYPAGHFADSQGHSLSLGVAYKLVDYPLPWRYTPATADDGNTFLLQLCVVDGLHDEITANFALTVNNSGIQCVSLTSDGTYWPYQAVIYDSLSISADGKRLVYVSDADLANEPAGPPMRVYLREMTSGKLSVVSRNSAASCYSAAISGDGRHVFFVTIAGQLHDYRVPSNTTMLLEDGVNAYAPFAVNFNGTVLLYEKNGGLVLRSAGMEMPLPVPVGTTDIVNPSLSRDGQTALFLATPDFREPYTLYAWYATLPDVVEPLLTEVDYAALSMSGARALVQQRDAQGGALFKRIAVGGPDRQEQLLLWPTDVDSPAISGNGRFAGYVRQPLDCACQQAFTYDFNTQTERPASYSRNTYGDAPSNHAVATALSLQGDFFCFVSAASNLSPSDGNIADDVFRAEIPLPPQAPPVLATLADLPVVPGQPLVLQIDEDQSLLLPMSYQDADGDDAIATLVSPPAIGTVAFLGPDASRPWCALQYNPSLDKVGEDTFTICLWDGNATSIPTTVVMSIRNVNDPPAWQDDLPAAVASLAVIEGQEPMLVELAQYASDPDLANPAPWTDTLSFALAAGAPAWVTINSATGQLRIQPGFDAVRRDQSPAQRTFALGCVVRDLGGAEDHLNVTVTVEHVNRPPVISTYPAVVFEGVEVPLAAFVVSDPDAEDPPELLTLEFTSVAGKWSCSATGRTFTAAASAVNSTTSTVQAKDGGGMKSEAKTITVRVMKMQQSLLTLWPRDGASGSPFKTGWQLLAMPFTVDTAGVNQLLAALGTGAAVWRWDNAKGHYTTPAQLQAGEGFWCFLTELPPNMNVAISGKRSLTPREFAPAWHLIGLRSDEDTLGLPSAPTVPGCHLWRLSKEGYFARLADTFTPEIGRGYWFFQTAQ